MINQNNFGTVTTGSSNSSSALKSELQKSIEIESSQFDSAGMGLPHRAAGESLLKFILIVASLLAWTLLAVSVVGLLYLVFFGLLIFLGHLSFVAYLRSSAVRVSENQFPELHQSLIRLTKKIGLKRVPEFYLTQSGGALNALATKFRGSNMVVVYTELLEACGNNENARDFIIAHELSHLKAGHLNWFWLLAPGKMIPFLGKAYSRACEYTCDAWGFWAVGRTDNALEGLKVLAVGGKLASQVNIEQYLAQREQLNTGLMTLGRWLSTHPGLTERIAALRQDLFGKTKVSLASRFVAITVGILLVVLPLTAFAGFMAYSVKNAPQQSADE